MVVFALSCFGLLLFLWLSFGGPIPLKPKGYRVQGRVPRGDAARHRGRRARRRRDRSARCAQKTLDPAHRNRTVATIELDPSYAPMRQDAQAILRQKTLLGETYVELTPGHDDGETIPEGGGCRTGRSRTPSSSTRSSTRSTRRRARRSAAGSRSSRRAIDGPRAATSTTRSARCPASPHDGTDLLTVLDAQQGAVAAARQQHRRRVRRAAARTRRSCTT